MDNFKIIATIIFIILLIGIISSRKSKISNTLSLQESTGINKTYNINEDEFLLIYIGSSSCPFCNDSRLSPIIDSIVDKIKSYSDSLNYSFKFIGISNDFNIKSGVEHLESLYDFDEISTGSGYNNSGIIRYLWDYDVPIKKVGIPQLVLVQRKYQRSDSTNLPFRLLEKERILNRSVGINSIISLSKSNLDFE